MSKPKNREYCLSFTKADAGIIIERANELDVGDLTYLQDEVDKMITKWKEEEMFF